MCRRRYHRDLGIPEGVPLRPPTGALRWTAHALEQLHQDGFHGDRALDEKAKCIEVTLEPDGSVWRWLMRQRLTSSNDLCMVVENNGTVVTCWVNHVGDTHRTLNRRLYSIPDTRRCPMR